jgi:diaminopimelate decarboxylase
VLGHADKIIFNTIGQLERFDGPSAGHVRGLRVNPGVSTSDFDLADPARPFSRLGEHDPEEIAKVADRISGFMFHNNCENADFDRFDRMLGHIEQRFGHLVRQMDWISLGGGIHFTGEGYPLDRLAERLKRFAGENEVQVYLEPGEAAITNSATLEVSVLDTLFNGKHLAIVDSSTEAHMLDLLIYRQSARMLPNDGPARMDDLRQVLPGRRHLRRVPLPRAAEARRPAVDPGRGRLHDGQEELVQRREDAGHRDPRTGWNRAPCARLRIRGLCRSAVLRAAID